MTRAGQHPQPPGAAPGQPPQPPGAAPDVPAAAGGLAERYRWFAEREARGRSPLYERFAAGVAEDPEVLALLERVPPPKQQPNLLFAAVAFLAGVQPDYEAFRGVVLDRAEEVLATLAARRTQTNEVGRCATLLPVLAQLPGPLALLEAGASAGLCLLPDRYAYDYGRGMVGDPASGVLLRCEPRGPVPVPAAVPAVVWRRGIDIAPLDVTDDEDVRWLECCVWPGQPERLDRLRAAVRVARADPPPVTRGDLLDTVAEVASTGPPDATLVVFHSAVLYYLTADERRRFGQVMAEVPGVWISNEAAGVVESLPGGAFPGLDETSHFVVGRDGGRVLAAADPHGAWVQWATAGP